MTTNQARAAALLDRLHAADQMAMEGAIGYFNATAAAVALADAGLLAPDLPEPTKRKWGAQWPVAAHVVVTRIGGPVTIMRTKYGRDGMTPDEAEALAAAILAAAHHARKDTQ